MEGGRGTREEFALVVAGDCGDITEGRWSVLVLEDMETLASMFQGRPVRQSSATKVLLKFEGVDSFDWTGPRVGDGVDRNGGPVTRRVGGVLEMAL
jgi:hypothetical protein